MLAADVEDEAADAASDVDAFAEYAEDAANESEQDAAEGDFDESNDDEQDDAEAEREEDFDEEQDDVEDELGAVEVEDERDDVEGEEDGDGSLPDAMLDADEPSSTVAPRCPGGHTCALLTTEDAVTSALSCDSCGTAIISGGTEFYSCATCDFDLCMACSTATVGGRADPAGGDGSAGASSSAAGRRASPSGGKIRHNQQSELAKLAMHEDFRFRGNKSGGASSSAAAGGGGKERAAGGGGGKSHKPEGMPRLAGIVYGAFGLTQGNGVHGRQLAKPTAAAAAAGAGAAARSKRRPSSSNRTERWASGAGGSCSSRACARR